MMHAVIRGPDRDRIERAVDHFRTRCLGGACPRPPAPSEFTCPECESRFCGAACMADPKHAIVCASCKADRWLLRQKQHTWWGGPLSPGILHLLVIDTEAPPSLADLVPLTRLEQPWCPPLYVEIAAIADTAIQKGTVHLSSDQAADLVRAFCDIRAHVPHARALPLLARRLRDPASLINLLHAYFDDPPVPWSLVNALLNECPAAILAFFTARSAPTAALLATDHACKPLLASVFCYGITFVHTHVERLLELCPRDTRGPWTMSADPEFLLALTHVMGGADILLSIARCIPSGPSGPLLNDLRRTLEALRFCRLSDGTLLCASTPVAACFLLFAELSPDAAPLLAFAVLTCTSMADALTRSFLRTLAGPANPTVVREVRNLLCLCPARPAPNPAVRVARRLARTHPAGAALVASELARVGAAESPYMLKLLRHLRAKPRTCLGPACGAHAPLLQCSRCLGARYCSRTCQRAHFAAHKPACVPHATPALSPDAFARAWT